MMPAFDVGGRDDGRGDDGGAPDASDRRKVANIGEGGARGCFFQARYGNSGVLKCDAFCVVQVSMLSG